MSKEHAYAYEAGYKDGLEAAQVETVKLWELVHILVHCMSEVDNCDLCPLNDNPYDVSVDHWFACDGLHDLLSDVGIETRHE